MESNQTYYQELIVSFLSKEASQDEIDELNAWLESSEENKQIFNSYLHSWQVSSLSESAVKINIKKAWDKVNKQTLSAGRSKTKQLIYTLSKYAAIILVFAGLSFIAYHYWQTSLKKEMPQVAASGRIILHDGTVINLNEKSGDIAYNQKNGKITLNNEIILSGKAEAGKKQSHDFISYKKMAYNTIIVPNGHYYKLIFPDGTTAWVNSGSTLKYYSENPSDLRMVELQGEAYFDVTHNKSIPFIVKINEIDVKVLGTSFNVKSMEGDDLIKTTLVSGSIQLTGKKDKYKSFEIKINPGEQAIYSKTIKNIEVFKVDTEMYCCWKDGYFKFLNTPFSEVIKSISRIYGVEIVLQGDERNFNKKISGKLIRNYSITQALDNLSLLKPFEYQIKENKINIYSKTN